jgi:hypothetical protein
LPAKKATRKTTVVAAIDKRAMPVGTIIVVTIALAGAWENCVIPVGSVLAPADTLETAA